MRWRIIWQSFPPLNICWRASTIILFARPIGNTCFLPPLLSFESLSAWLGPGRPGQPSLQLVGHGAARVSPSSYVRLSGQWIRPDWFHTLKLTVHLRCAWSGRTLGNKLCLPDAVCPYRPLLNVNHVTWFKGRVLHWKERWGWVDRLLWMVSQIRATFVN